MLWLGLKEGVGDAQMVQCAELKEALTVVVHLADAVMTEAIRPGVVVCSHSGVEITKYRSTASLLGMLWMVACSCL